MENSIFLARLIGPAFAVMGIALAVQPNLFSAVIQDFSESPGLVYLTGLLGFLAGLALVLTHNLWRADWRLLITLIGWLTLIRALVTLFVPQTITSIGLWFVAHRGGLRIGAALALALGAILCWFGYSA